MKYNPFLLSILTALLMACSHSGGGPGTVIEPEEPPVETGTPIVFAAEEQQEGSVTRSDGSQKCGQGWPRSQVCPGSQTRATGLEEKGIQTITVWGYKNMEYENGSYGGLQQVFPGYIVRWKANTAATTTTNSHDWEYVGIGDQTIKYWDWSANAYRFIGATGYPDYEVKTVGGDEVLEISMDVDGENLSTTSYYSHLWFSTGAPGEKQFGKTVVLEFALPLARVRFILKAVVSVDLPEPVLEDIEFKPVTGGIPDKGTFTVTYPLTGTSTTESWSTSSITHSIPELRVPYTEENNKWYNVLPVREQEPYKLTLLINGEEREAAVPAAYMEWLPGYEYTYIFKINEKGGVELEGYNAAYTDWKVGTEATPSIYNW